MISLYVLLNVHTLSQCDNSSTFKNIGGDVDKGDISVGYGYMNNRAYLQQNYLGLLINDNDRIDTDMNETL